MAHDGLFAERVVVERSLQNFSLPAERNPITFQLDGYEESEFMAHMVNIEYLSSNTKIVSIACQY